MPDTTQQQHPILLAGRYRLDEVVGSGGMSTVHRAFDTVLHRPVAIKLLRPLAGDLAVITREQREIRTLAALNHHCLVTLFDADVVVLDAVTTTFLVMELIDGPSLAVRLREGNVASSEVRDWAGDLLEALLVIHSSGVVHRDIKPGNILLAPSLLPDRNYTAKLTDFGIASLLGATRITSTGTIVGTAAYLSPEQALGRAVGPATDIYSLGLVILETLTGSPPFVGTMVETISARLHHNPDVPASLGPLWCSVLTAMTQRDPDARPTALELIGQLTQSHPETTAEIVSPLPGLPAAPEPVTLLLPVTFPVVTPPITPSRNRTTRSRRGRFRGVVLGLSAGLLIAGLITIVSIAAGGPGTQLPEPSPSGSVRQTSIPSPINSASFLPVPATPTPTVPRSGKGNGHNQGNGDINKK